MTDAEKFFNELTQGIPDAKPGKMFGALCMKLPNGKSAAMFWKDAIVVKLKGNHLQEALHLKGAQLFEPMDGKPMKEWVQIPFDYKDKWKGFALASADNVKTLPAKAPTKRK